MQAGRRLARKMRRVYPSLSDSPHQRQRSLTGQYARPGRASPTGYEKPCSRRRIAVKTTHNHVQKVDARSLGLPNRDCKERGACQLTDAPKPIGMLHTL